MLPPSVAAEGSCAAPELLPLVDAAFERQGGPAQRKLEAEICPTCPIWRECLDDAVQNGEAGPWGGTNKRARNKAVPTPDCHNMRDVLYPGTGKEITALPARRFTRGPDRRVARLAELGVTSGQVKQWAVDHGLLPADSDWLKGRASSDLIEKYAAAHAA